MDTFGYLVFPGLLSDKIDQIIEQFEAVFAQHGGGHHGRPHDGTARSCLVPFIDQSDYLAALLDDPRIDGIFTSLLGEDYNYLGSDGNYYVGDTGWHSDTDWSGRMRGKPPRIFYKLALYLDPVTGDSGALRVIPGSHRYGDRFAEDLQQTLRSSQQKLGISGAQVPAIRTPSIVLGAAATAGGCLPSIVRPAMKRMRCPICATKSAPLPVSGSSRSMARPCCAQPPHSAWCICNSRWAIRII
jgi:hypothetical protein